MKTIHSATLADGTKKTRTSNGSQRYFFAATFKSKTGEVAVVSWHSTRSLADDRVAAGNRYAIENSSGSNFSVVPVTVEKKSVFSSNQLEWLGWALDGMAGLGSDGASELWSCTEEMAVEFIEIVDLASSKLSEGDLGLRLIARVFGEDLLADLRYRLTEQAVEMSFEEGGLFGANSARSAKSAWTKIEKELV